MFYGWEHLFEYMITFPYMHGFVRSKQKYKFGCSKIRQRKTWNMCYQCLIASSSLYYFFPKIENLNVNFVFFIITKNCLLFETSKCKFRYANVLPIISCLLSELMYLITFVIFLEQYWWLKFHSVSFH